MSIRYNFCRYDFCDNCSTRYFQHSTKCPSRKGRACLMDYALDASQKCRSPSGFDVQHMDGHYVNVTDVDGLFCSSCVRSVNLLINERLKVAGVRQTESDMSEFRRELKRSYQELERLERRKGDESKHKLKFVYCHEKYLERACHVEAARGWQIVGTGPGVLRGGIAITFRRRQVA